MHILVTGSKGIIGSRLVEMLRAKGHIVHGVDLSHSDGEIGFEHPMRNGEWVYSRCDIADYRQIERIFKLKLSFDLVYNCAAEFGRWNGEDYYEQVWRTNVIGLRNILELQKIYAFNLVHFSSSEVYGDFDGLMIEWVMDQIEIKQMNDYALTKWVNEIQIGNYSKQHGNRVVIVRVFNTYGPGEWYHPYRSVNAKFCYHLLHGIPITVYGGHERTSLYLDDACRTFCAISDNFLPGRIYNVGGEGSHTIENLAEMALRYTGADRRLISCESSEIMTTRVKHVDSTLAQTELGHACTVSLEEGVKRTVEWMKGYYKL